MYFVPKKPGRRSQPVGTQPPDAGKPPVRRSKPASAPPGSKEASPGALETSAPLNAAAPAAPTPAMPRSAPAEATAAPDETTSTSPDSGRCEVTSIAFLEEYVRCGDTVTIEGTTKGVENGTKVPVQLECNGQMIGETSAVVSSNTFRARWKVTNAVPNASGPKEVQVLAVASAVRSLPLTVALLTAVQETRYHRDRSHFYLAMKAGEVVIASDIEWVKGWGASVVSLGKAAGKAGGLIADFDWDGYRWMKQEGVKHRFWNGEAWKPLPKDFKLADHNNFCVGFYEDGNRFKCQYGGYWPEVFTDWSPDEPRHVKRLGQWKDNIEITWSGKARLRRVECGSTNGLCCSHATRTEVCFEKFDAFESGRLVVATGNIRSNDQLWFIDDNDLDMASHEFGHHLGNPDEYKGAEVDASLNGDGAVKGIDANSIMGQKMTKVKKRHYRTICSHLAGRIHAEHGVEGTWHAVMTS